MRVRERLGMLWGSLDARSSADVAAEVDEELRSHVELCAADLVAGGMDPAEAEREARRRFGSPDDARRACLRIHLGGKLMLYRVHVVVTVFLLFAVTGFAWRNHVLRIEAVQAQAVMHEALAEAMHRLEPPPVEEIVVRVGDTVEIVDGVHPDALNRTETVALDGNILVPGAGWVPVAGLTRAEAEVVVRGALEPFFAETSLHLKVSR